MGINPYNAYRNFSTNIISDPGAELKRQLETRKDQLDKLNAKDVLSSEQLSRKKDLEETVSLLQKKLDKRQGGSDYTAVSKKPAVDKSPYVQNYTEGTVISKVSYPDTSYKPSTTKDDSYLKGFFFDTRI